MRTSPFRCHAPRSGGRGAGRCASEERKHVEIREAKWHPSSQPESIEQKVHIVVRAPMERNEIFVPFRAEPGVLDVMEIIAAKIPRVGANRAHRPGRRSPPLSRIPRLAALSPLRRVDVRVVPLLPRAPATDPKLDRGCRQDQACDLSQA